MRHHVTRQSTGSNILYRSFAPEAIEQDINKHIKTRLQVLPDNKNCFID